jgi:hypothetical protein
LPPPGIVPPHRNERSRSPIAHRHCHYITATSLAPSSAYRPPPVQCDMCGDPIVFALPLGYVPLGYRYCIRCEDWWRLVTTGRRCAMCRTVHHVEDVLQADGYWYCHRCDDWWHGVKPQSR